jgi:hypothetical protein
MEVGEGHQFQPVGLDRQHWSSAGPIREVFRRAFAAVGLPYFSPHRLRDTPVAFAQRRCRTPEEFKAWSQNLGHSQVLTTLTSYSSVRGLVEKEAPPSAALDKVAAILAKYRHSSASGG